MAEAGGARARPSAAGVPAGADDAPLPDRRPAARRHAAAPNKRQEQPAGPTIEAQDCCDRVTANSDRPAADVARPATRDLAPIDAVAVVLDATMLTPVARPFDRAVHRYGPAGEGPPLVLLKHAFLI